MAQLIFAPNFPGRQNTLLPKSKAKSTVLDVPLFLAASVTNNEPVNPATNLFLSKNLYFFIGDVGTYSDIIKCFLSNSL